MAPLQPPLSAENGRTVAPRNASATDRSTQKSVARCQVLKNLGAGELETLRAAAQDGFARNDIASGCIDKEACEIASALLLSSNQNEFDRNLSEGGSLAQLYRSLNTGCLVLGFDCQRAENNLAIEQLEKLEALDPDNGIYSYYQAQLLLKIGAPEADLRSAMDRYLIAKKFDNGWRRISAEVIRLVIERRLDPILGIGWLITTPVPDIVHPGGLISKFLEDPSMDWEQVMSFSDRVIQQHNPVEGIPSEMTSDILLAAVGIVHGRIAFEKMWPGKANPYAPGKKQAIREGFVKNLFTELLARPALDQAAVPGCSDRSVEESLESAIDELGRKIF